MSRRASAIAAGSGSHRPRSQQPDSASPARHREADPRFTFRTHLGNYKAAPLEAILRTITPGDSERQLPTRVTWLVDEISEALDKSKDASGPSSGLPPTSLLIPPILALTETASISVAGLRHAVGLMGVEPDSAILPLLERGLLAIGRAPDPEPHPVDDIQSFLKNCDPNLTGFFAHPSMMRDARTPRLESTCPTIPSASVGQIRESDGLEPILRLGAIWQLVATAPLRQTQQGALYKRDRERLDERAVLKDSGPDALVDVADLPSLWLSLAIKVGLVEIEANGERLLASSPEFWDENAVHLHHMIATAWMGVRTWQEIVPEETEVEGPFPLKALPHARLPILLWLGSLAEDDWVSLEDLASYLGQHDPAWARISFQETAEPQPNPKPRKGSAPRKVRDAEETSSGPPPGTQILESILLNSALRLGLVRAGEEKVGRRRVVQLTQRGRYVLALGPPPPPPPTIEHFLFVQPNFEVIAYRQGLTPKLVGRLSRFVQWSNIGAAIELKVTNESIVLGLDGGLTPDQMLDTLSSHCSRPLPTGIIEAVRSWASRRDRVTCYAKATLIEFASRRELDQALELWPGGPSDRSYPVVISDRLLLVEDERLIPFDRLRLVGSRDYRHPPETCLSVSDDGISLTLDPAKADLLIDAELGRFTNETSSLEPTSPRGGQTAPLFRRFEISTASLDRAIEAGMTEEQLEEWFPRRTGQPIPPASRLMLRSRLNAIPKLKTKRLLILQAPSPEILDGLLQHPETRDLLGERLGDTAVSIEEAKLPRLSEALVTLGIELTATIEKS